MNITKDNYKTYFDALDNEVRVVEDCGSGLVKDIVSKLKLELEGKRNGAEELMADNQMLKIGVVGQVKAGKSSFLNSLFFDGENVLPRASTPMTAGLTILEYGEENKFIVEYYNAKEWSGFESRAKEYDDIISCYKASNPELSEADVVKMAETDIDIALKTAKELVTFCDREAKSKIREKTFTEEKSFFDIKDLQDILEMYVGANGKFTSVVKSLTIQMKDERLKDLQIVDTPGVNDPVVSREQRTREFLRGCHGVFLLSYSGRFFDSTDVEFLCSRIGSEGVGTVVLIASKFDSVLQDVGKQFDNDLGAAIDHSQKQQRKQYRDNISCSSFCGKDPILDFSSGIGFSISKKDSERWDDIESHVVKRMKIYYPDFFSTPEDVKNTFFALSQMDTIRDKYLDEIFVKNKDKIIGEKIDAYFAFASGELCKIVKQQIKSLSDKLEVLKATDIKDLEAKKQSTEKAIKSIEKGISSVSERIKSKAEAARKECQNSARFSVPSIPTRTESRIFVRTSTSFLRRDKTFEASYDVVDVNRLVDSLDKGASSAVKELSRTWKNKVEELKSFLQSEIGNRITQEEQNDTTGQFDADILRNIMYDVIDKMSAEAILNERELLDRFKDNCLSALQGVDYVSYSQQCFAGEDAEGRSYVRSLAEGCRSEARGIASSLVSGFNSEVEEELNSICQKVINVVVGNKQEFIDAMKENSQRFLEELQAELRDKEENIKSVEVALQALNNFNGKL